MPTVPGYADISVELTQTGLTRPAYVTFGVDPTATDPALIAADVFNAWTYTGSMHSLIDSTVTLTAVRVSYGTDGSADLVYVGSYSTVGGRSGSFLPPNSAALVHKVTARGGRRGRGRMYLPWTLQITDCGESGTVVAGIQTTINNACGVFLTRLSTTANAMVLLHREGQTTMGAPDPVTQLRADNLVGTQRRRVGR